MSNLYANTTSPAAMADLFAANADRVPDLPPQYAVPSGSVAPVVRKGADGARRIELMRWSMPGPAHVGGQPLTVIQDVADPDRHDWLTPEHRCLVPATAFSVYNNGGKEIHWFARDESRTPFAFAGIWRPSTGEVGGEAEGDRHPLFDFLTTEPNAIVSTVNADTMPVILIEDDWDTWLEGDVEAALALLRPAPDELLITVSTGEQRDPPESRMGYQ
jgi:putative SOS response-associated peptidase YedK